MTEDVTVRDIIRPSHINRITPDDGEIIVGSPTGPVRRSSTDFDNSAIAAEVAAVQGIPAQVDTLATQVAAKADVASVTAVSTVATRADTRVFDIEKYGANPDGSGDNTAAVQAAIDAATAAGGGTVWLPHPVDYNCTTITTNAGLSWVLSIVGDHITVTGVPGSGLKTTAAASLLHMTGAGKPGGIMAWHSGFLGNIHPTTKQPLTPVYAMMPAAKYDTAITLAAPADAAQFAPGDIIYIRTGHTVATYSALDIPDAEMNEVVSANTTTGVITLLHPLGKPYVQETYPAGHDRAGLPAPFGVSNVTDRILRDITFRGIRLIQGSERILVDGGQVWGLIFDGCYVESNAHFQGLNYVREGRYKRNTVNLQRSTASTSWWFTTAVGSSDIEIADNTCTVRGPDGGGTVHIHEGSTNVRLVGGSYVSHATGSSTGTIYTVSVRSRAYDIEIRDAVLRTKNAQAIFVDKSCRGGGRIENITAIRASGGTSITVEAPNWHVSTRNRTPGGVTRVHSPSDPGMWVSGPTYTQSMFMQGWVTRSNQSITLGIIPENASVVRVHVQVMEGFNSDGTDVINIGSPGSPGYWANNLDVSTFGIKSASGSSIYAIGHQFSDRQVVATYTAGGTAPTQGRALVMLEYVMAPDEPTG